MKKINIIYWIITGLFSAFMLFTAIPDILLVPDAIKFISDLGYPLYFIVFIGIAKVLGSIAIVIPGFPRIKEWAYAGLIFDLIAAMYSIAATAGIAASLPLVLFIAVAFTSYFLYHKKLKESKIQNA